MSRNDEAAARNRGFLDSLEILGINIISSPGAGKTTLLEALGIALGSELAVIEGDVRTRRDAERLEKIGIRAFQIETGGACHLDALSVEQALGRLGLEKGIQRFLVIENVGNLICPSAYDLGERIKVGLLSLPEGDDKVLKYPSLFSRIDLLLLSKVDLEPHMRFDQERAISECRSLNDDVETIPVSAVTGRRSPESIDLLRRRRRGIWKD
jgi:hydrogenase nickel incorporation protein HypB